MAHIKTYARVKPATCLYDDYDTTPHTLYLRVPENLHENKYGTHARSRYVLPSFKIAPSGSFSHYKMLKLI